ncbi:DEAD/DEAH box helicase [Aminirod propionatiphilus]|uniref:DEAD/DEAH box helicase n=1 Tax=Aminirod propionatiphilus TaxID=3415223 RepID=A0ACD1DY14_9BACT|nr:DEAD/DEAH box helicase [Synergistota bacterium]
MRIQPRPYQIEAIQAVKNARDDGVTRQLLSVPTGSGKTIIFSLLIREMNTKTIIVAHREELLQQAWEKMKMVCPEIPVGLVRGNRDEYDAQVVICSVQTATRPNRLAELRRRGFSLMIIDEAHHAAAESYKRLVADLGFAGDDPTKLLVGVTATAFRGDGKALGDVFQEVVFERTIMSMIRGGYLTDAVGLSVSTDVDLSGVHSRMGDFVTNELADAINIPERNKVIAESYLAHSADRKAVAFCADVEHARDLAESFRKEGVPAAPIWGDMDRSARKHLLHMFHLGNVRVLTNCAVLTEGFDDPAISAVLLARPTKSAGLYCQMVGRGLRLYPGKEDCLVMDFACNTGKHSLCSLSTLVGDANVRPRQGETLCEAVDRAELEREQEERGAINLGKVHTAQIDLFERSAFVWTEVPGGHFRLAVEGAEYLFLKCVGIDSYVVGLVKNGALDHKLSDLALPLGYAQGLAEDFVRQRGSLLARKNAKWRKNEVSEGQLRLLDKLGIAFRQGMTRGEASTLIDKEIAARDVWKMEPATPKQMQYLRKVGVEIPAGMTKGEAGRIICRYKAREEAEARALKEKEEVA